MTLRRWAIVAAALIAIGAFEPFYLKVFTMRRDAMRAMLTELPYSKTPGLRRFLNDVRARTKRGDTIAIAAPFATWDGGYDYVFARSPYTLAGRRVLPLIDEADRPRPENLARADYVAAYRVNATVPSFDVVWRSADGVLLRRRR